MICALLSFKQIEEKKRRQIICRLFSIKGGSLLYEMRMFVKRVNHVFGYLQLTVIFQFTYAILEIAF